MTMQRTVLSLLLLAAPLLAQASPPTIRIGTWNLEFLGAEPQLRRDTPPRTEADVQAIGQKIGALGVCVLAVQEICGEAILQRLTAATGSTWSSVLGTTGQWNDGKTQQGIGFLYDRAVVELVHAEELLDFPRNREDVSVFHRKPVTACFRHRESGCDFRLVTVHLKAGIKSRDENKRRVEATVLREWVDLLQSRPSEDPDIMLLGDFNCTYGTLPERLLEDGGAMRFLEPATPTASIMHFDAQIDHVVAARGFHELRLDSLVVHHVADDEARRAFRKTYSDHFPVTVEIVAEPDDDNDATFRRGAASQRLPVAARPKGAQRTNSWPPPVGATVIVRTGRGVSVSGKLLKPIPEGPGGWIVIEGTEGAEAIPVASVQSVRVK